MDIYRIKDRRKSLGFSQEYVALKLGISQKAYSDIESGKTKLKTDVLNEIAKILEISPFSVCPIACECSNEIEMKHKELVAYLMKNGIEFPIELI
ncbi:helix-turn-helix domain-containing protein [Myroides injenensis]|uniref:helix-turn-helix domain-containing protein n=1 Tax=Myroides injenensis TaxID=1183151 RepID=UPI000289688E|nr:helix-turn-helix transcriptional regulator [Myroides injenensis]